MCWKEEGRIGHGEKQGCASADPQGSSVAGMIQIEAGSQALVPSINHSLGTDCARREHHFG